MFIAFYFEIDDQIERTNQNIKIELRQYCNYRQNDWIDWIDIMKFVENNDVFTITKFISFFINKNYHFRMIFDSNLNDYEIIKKRLLIKQNEFIVEKINRIIEYVKINVIDVKQKMIVRNKQISFINKFWNKKLCLIKSSSHKDRTFIWQIKR